MSAYATKLAEGFAQKVLLQYFQTAVSEMITNQEYEGEIKDQKSVLNILTFGKLSLHDYTGSDMTADAISESNAQLITNQKKYYYFNVPSLARFQSWIKNPEGTILQTTANVLKETVDNFVLSFYGDVQAGQRIGVNYITGTVTVDVTTGAVTGSSTVFTAAMVGRGFKATGHSVWYRVKSYASATSIVIEDDLDDTTSAYTGGAIGAGASYIIEANTPLQVVASESSTNGIYTQLVAAKTLLDAAKIPASDRWVVLPAVIANLFLNSPRLITAVGASYEEVVKRGLIGMVAGFNVYSNEQVNGNNTSGWRCLAGHKSAICYALGFVETGIEDAYKNFGKNYKGLNVYGAKVPDERRKALVELFLYV